MEYERQSRANRQDAGSPSGPSDKTLSGPVGIRYRTTKVANHVADQQTVISLLAAIPEQKGGKQKEWAVRPLAGGPGQCPPALADAILKFQEFWKKAGVFRYPDGVVDPGGNTLRQLNLLARHGGVPLPPGPKPPGPVPAEISEWFVTDLSLTGGAIIPGVGGGAYWGPIEFEQFGTSYSKLNANMFIAGVGFGASLGIPWGKVGGLEKVLAFLFDNGGLSYSGFPSRTIGLCFPNKGAGRQKLTAADFYGPCVTHFVSANVFVGGYGAWALYFGLPPDQNWLVYLGQSVQPQIAVGSVIAEKAKGFALISSGGFAGSLSAGGSLNLFAGEISRGKPNIGPDPSVR